MRMWMVNPSQMCNKHLLGEHVKCHMIAGALKKQRNINGFIKNGLIDLRLLNNRHNELALEMTVRGINHCTPIIIPDYNYLIDLPDTIIDVEVSKQELNKRCKDCNTEG